MILLDTHVLIWAIDDDPRLGGRARAIIEQDDDRRVSTMVAWEIAMLARKGRLTFSMTMEAWIDRSMADLAAHDVAVSRAIAREAGALTDPLHGDPADRIMIATARVLDCPLLTADATILRYAADRKSVV